MSETVIEKQAATVSVAAPLLPQSITAAPDFEAAAVQGLPRWWRAASQEAWSRFTALPMPHKKNEAWRFATISRLTLAGLAGYQANLPVSAAARTEILETSVAARRQRGTPLAGYAVFGNDGLLAFQGVSPELAAQGVVFLPLAEALQSREHSALLETYFMTRETTLGSQKFEALHRAFCRAGVLLYVPKGVEVAAPFEVFHWIADGTAAVFPHALVIAEDNACVELEVHFRSTEAARGGFACGAGDLYAGPGAKVRHITVQNWDESVLSIQTGATTVERDAHAVSLGIHLGAHYARTENKSRMVGPGGRSDMFSLTASHADQEFDQRTYQEHAAPHTTSDLLYKNALADTSRTIFAGMIAVDPGAQQTDAYQSNRNLLLSDTAEANSLPGLEIQANDVRCTHGSTSGQISEEEMFYMAQRGIPRSVARHLFVLGFFDEVLTRLGDPQLAEELHSLLEAKFARLKKKA